MEKKAPNFYMIPGSREKDTEGTFRDTSINNYMTMANAGHEDSPVAKHKPGHLSGEEVEKQSIGTRDTGVGGSHGQRKLGRNISARIGKEHGPTDLLDVAKSAYKKVKNYFSS